MKRVDDAAMRLSTLLKGRKIYAEVDDFGGTSLKLMVEYLIPKRRGPFSLQGGNGNA